MTRYINELHIITFIKINAWAKTNSIEKYYKRSMRHDRRTDLEQFTLTLTSIQNIDHKAM